MIQLQSADQLKRATERARAGKLFVQATGMFRQYRVTNRENGNAYVVDFFVPRRPCGSVTAHAKQASITKLANISRRRLRCT